MGGVVSTGADNDDLINNLLHADYIKTARVERVFRAVDRADYFLEESRSDAYKDSAWKNGHLHLSAPCIYSEVMEGLQLKPGLSFLNLGSGTGYLSTMVGLILGPYGTNHGIEIYDDVIQYANKKLDHFLKFSAALDEYEFCPPKFVQGNCLCLNTDFPQYDRVYCGAACPENHENYMKNLIKVGGILIMPVNDKLLQIKRTSETSWEETFLLSVSFASLISPTGDPTETPKTLDFEPLTLQAICRSAIRTILRNNIDLEHPDIKKTIYNTPKRPKKKRALRRLFVPIFEESDMETSDNLSEEDDSRPDFGRVRLNPSENHGGREITSILDLVLGSLTSRNRERGNENQNAGSDSENESNLETEPNETETAPNEPNVHSNNSENTQSDSTRPISNANHATLESKRATNTKTAPSDSKTTPFDSKTAPSDSKTVSNEFKRTTTESKRAPSDLNWDHDSKRGNFGSKSSSWSPTEEFHESDEDFNESKCLKNDSKNLYKSKKAPKSSNDKYFDSYCPKNEKNTIRYESDSPTFESCESKTAENVSEDLNSTNVSHELSITWNKDYSNQNCESNMSREPIGSSDLSSNSIFKFKTGDSSTNQKCDIKCDCILDESLSHEIGCSEMTRNDKVCDIRSDSVIATHSSESNDSATRGSNLSKNSKKELNLVEFLQLDDIRVENDNPKIPVRKTNREKFDSGIGDDKWSSDSENANNMEIDSDSDSENTSHKGKSPYQRPNLFSSNQKLKRFSMRSYVESDSDSDMILDETHEMLELSQESPVSLPAVYESPYTVHMRAKIQALPLPTILKNYLNLFREF